MICGESPLPPRSSTALRLKFSLHSTTWSFPGRSDGKESACDTGDPDSIPGLGRFPWRRERCPLQYWGLENSIDCIVHGVAKSRIQLSVFGCSGFLLLCRDFLSSCGSRGYSFMAVHGLFIEVVSLVVEHRL